MSPLVLNESVREGRDGQLGRRADVKPGKEKANALIRVFIPSHTHLPAHHVRKLWGQHSEAQSKETLALCSATYPCVTLGAFLNLPIKKG